MVSFNIIAKDKNGTQIHAFDLETTCNMKEFETYYRLRESNQKIDPKKWHHEFGKDLCFHLEMAYSLLKEEESSQDS